MFLNRLESLMQEKGINKHILAKESGIPYTTVDGWYKKGYENIRLSTLQKLSNYFGVSLDALIDDNTEDAAGKHGEKMAFSEKLRALLASHNMKSVELAKKAGISEAAISEYLSGKKEPRAKQSILIANALNVSLDELWETSFSTSKTAAPAKELEPPLTEEERTLIREFRNLKEADSRDRVWETIYGRQQIEVVHERERQQLALMAEQQNYGTSDDSARRKSSSK